MGMYKESGVDRYKNIAIPEGDLAGLEKTKI
jgi:hypothetical protein